MRFSAQLDTSKHGRPHPFKDAGLVAYSLTGTHNATVKCQKELPAQGSLRVPTGKYPEDSNPVSVEASESSSTYPSFMISITENISHNTAKTFRGIIMCVPHSCFDCQ
jgi:hypothetical protein